GTNGSAGASPSRPRGKDHEATRNTRDERRAAGVDRQGHHQAPVPAAFPVGHRASGNPQRDQEGAARHRPPEDHSARTRAGRREEKGRRGSQGQCLKSFNKKSGAGGASRSASSPATRWTRPAASRSRGWSSTPVTASTSGGGPSATSTTSRTSRTSAT